ncbi:MAG: hypothetical protein ACP5KS_03000 [Candidatus Hydrogenedens sp.]
MMKYVLVFYDGTYVASTRAYSEKEAWEKFAKRFSRGEGPSEWKGLKPATILRILKDDGYEVMNAYQYRFEYES